MGFLGSVGGFVNKAVNKVVKPVIKDAIPLAAAVATGGTSLTYLKPTNTLSRLDKITGLPVTTVANLQFGGGQSQPQDQPQTIVEASVTPPMLPQQQSSIYDQITPYLNSFLQSSQQRSNDVSPNANILASQSVQQTAPRSNMMLIIGAVLAVAVGGFFLFRGKK